MTHKEFIAELSGRLGWTSAKTSQVCESAIAVVSENVADSNNVNVQGFGVFEGRFRKERVSVNPVSKQRFLVPPKITPVFRPGQTVKDNLKKL